MTYEIFNLAFIGGIGTTELILIGVLGVLIFGNKLPDVGRSLGKGIVEFKKGVKGVQDDIDDAEKKIDKETKGS
jgi:sec-independent protein translocase protein TatA